MTKVGEIRKGEDVVKETAAAPKPAKPGITSITGTDGRVFGLQKLKPSQRFLIAKKIETPNLSTLMQVLAVASVFSIDDEAFNLPENEKDILQRLDQIGDDGLEAITATVMSMYGTQLTQDEVATAKN